MEGESTRGEVRRVGLTGGIASGKSMVGAVLDACGALVIDADQVYHELLEHNAALRQRLVARFGAVVAPAASIDRRALAALVIRDPTALRDLNTITHPIIMDAVEQRIATADSAGGGPLVAVVEAALLIKSHIQWAFEALGERKQAVPTSYPSGFDALILVTAPLETRVTRLMARSSLTPDQARARIAAQLPDDAQRHHATWELINDGTLTDLNAAVAALWPRLKSAPWPPRSRGGGA